MPRLGDEAGAAGFSLVTLETEGADEQEAMTALLALIADYFGEGE